MVHKIDFYVNITKIVTEYFAIGLVIAIILLSTPRQHK